ncbi:MAG: FAD-dependent oxidoreductase [Homoserinimonas sp.]|nr:FAD-dependent oxidoreductase [Homoserinimonas sp.]
MNKDDLGEARHSDVLVVGAGIVGSAIARTLALRGRSVRVLDPAPGEGASLGNAGLVVPSYAVPMSTPANLVSGIRSAWSPDAVVRLGTPMSRETLLWMAKFALACRPSRVRRDTSTLHALATRSLDLYRDMSDEGVDLQLRNCGWLWAHQSSKSFRKAEETSTTLTRAGASCVVVNQAEAIQLEPALTAAVAGGIWFPHEAVLDSARASRVLLHSALDNGAILHRAAVTSASVSIEDAQVVHTRDGSYSADHVVVAVGSASRAVSRLFGDTIPVEPGYGWSITLADGDNTIQHALMAVDSHVVISPIGDQVRITGGMQFGGRASTQPTLADTRRLRSDAESLVPALARLKETASWQGSRPMTSTGLPVVARSARNCRIIYATGHGPLGVTLAPVTAELVATMVL